MIFNHFRIPKDNLLNRFGDVDEEGNYVSEIKSDDQRFGLQLGALSTGRILVAFAG